MENNFLIRKIACNNLKQELYSIGFDENYLNVAKDKYEHNLFKIFNLTPVQATILKQTALACGTDCAVNKRVLLHDVDFSDAILVATNAQLKAIIKKLYLQPFNLKLLAKNLADKLNQQIDAYKIGDTIFDWKKTYIMGILNCTRNSFSDGGEYFDIDKALDRYEDIILQGADIVDIGAESTAPESLPIEQEKEQEKLVEVLSRCKLKNSSVPISIDTRNAKTAQRMLELGADIINDVSGLAYDEKMAEIIAKYSAFVVICFDDFIKENTVDETLKGLMNKVDVAVSNGISEQKIILDVGLGFNKTFEQNITLIKCAKEFTSLGFPVLYGISRKSFIQKITGLIPKDTRDANISVGSFLASQGVNILRVHDVREHKNAFTALDKVLYD